MRKGGGSDLAAPEISADGRYVAFISAAPNNFLTGVPSSLVPNLYLLDRQTRRIELVSVSADGSPSNEPIMNYQLSSNGRRVMFETGASNTVTNDTNKKNDVFVRDLDLQQTFLVTVSTNNTAALLGGLDASMSADGNRVLFFSSSPDLTGQYTADLRLRDLSLASTKRICPDQLLYGAGPMGWSMSDDAEVIASTGYVDVEAGHSTYTLNTGVFDGQSGAFFLANETNTPVKFAPVVSGDGRFVFYDTPNQIIRFNTATRQREGIVTNDTTRPQPLISSYDGATLVLRSSAVALWKENQDIRTFPVPGGTPGLDLISSIDLTKDGNFTTFVADAQAQGSPQLYFYDIAANSVTRISPENDGLGLHDTSAPDPSISADGSLIVFSAISSTIDPNASRDSLNLYLWDRASGKCEFLTQATSNEFENTDRGDNTYSDTSVISDDGKKIVYVSTVPAPGGIDTNNTWDIFIFNPANETRTLVSVAADGTSAANAASFQPIISGDGNAVAFLSYASNLVSNATPPGPSLYLRELQSGVTRFISSMPGIIRKGPLPSFSLSADGRFLAFSTLAQFDARDTNTFWDVYVFDATTGIRSLMTYNWSKITGSRADSTFPSISPDGKFVAFLTQDGNISLGILRTWQPFLIRNVQTGDFVSTSTNQSSQGTAISPPLFDRASRISFINSYYLEGTSFRVFDLATHTLSTLCTNCAEGSLSANGQWLAFTTRDSQNLRSLFLRDVQSGATTPIATNVLCRFLSISANGEFVVFQCRESLLSNDVNGSRDIYLYNRLSGTVSLVSAHAGQTANGPSQKPILSPDQSYILFKSLSSDLVPNDFNNASDLFLAYLPGPDTDHDGLDDAWELANFGSLDLDGSGDADSDGLSDRDEFISGSAPNAAASSLRVETVQPENGGVRIRWTSIPGRAYRIQSSANLSGAWTDQIRSLIASDAETEVLLPTYAPSAQLYFRILSE